eukprot:241517-Pyramimonas_sp.AAC.1
MGTKKTEQAMRTHPEKSMRHWGNTRTLWARDDCQMRWTRPPLEGFISTGAPCHRERVTCGMCVGNALKEVYERDFHRCEWSTKTHASGEPVTHQGLRRLATRAAEREMRENIMDGG